MLEVRDVGGIGKGEEKVGEERRMERGMDGGAGSARRLVNLKDHNSTNITVHTRKALTNSP